MPQDGQKARPIRQTTTRLRGFLCTNTPFASVLGLEDFERFVYVLSVLERYPDQTCAVLLGTSIQQILEARIRGLRHIADSANRKDARQRSGFYPEREYISREAALTG